MTFRDLQKDDILKPYNILFEALDTYFIIKGKLTITDAAKYLSKNPTYTIGQSKLNLYALSTTAIRKTKSHIKISTDYKFQERQDLSLFENLTQDKLIKLHRYSTFYEQGNERLIIKGFDNFKTSKASTFSSTIGLRTASRKTINRNFTQYKIAQNYNYLPIDNDTLTALGIVYKI